MMFFMFIYTFHQHRSTIQGWGGFGFNCWDVRGTLARVILVVLECTWNAPAVSHVFPAFDDTGSLGSPPSQVVYLPG